MDGQRVQPQACLSEHKRSFDDLVATMHLICGRFLTSSQSHPASVSSITGRRFVACHLNLHDPWLAICIWRDTPIGHSSPRVENRIQSLCICVIIYVPSRDACINEVVCSWRSEILQAAATAAAADAVAAASG